jgi:ADP-ribosylglycohydrolase
MQTHYLEGIQKQFRYYKVLAEKTFHQLNDEELFHKPSEESNSISIIVRHLTGNMLSRFTDFLTSDGEKDWRHRDQEFEEGFRDRSEMMTKWEEAWKIVFQAIETVEDIEKLVYIRNQGHTVYEALNRQLAHYAYHVGQIVYLGKFLKNKDWKSLSIPKNQSSEFNSKKFSKAKNKGHFTDDFLSEDSSSD